MKIAAANPLWGAPRIHGELGKLGIAVSERTVSRLVRRPRRPPSQTWRTFLTNHVAALGSIDFFTVPTVTGRILFVFVLLLLLHHRRRIVHFNVTEHPTAAWTAQQIVDAFPDDSAPRWLLRDRDAIYGEGFRQRVVGMGIGEVLSGPSSPWQNPYAERLIGSIRRECLDHVIVLGERHLRREDPHGSGHPSAPITSHPSRVVTSRERGTVRSNASNACTFVAHILDRGRDVLGEHASARQ
jgi:putative transposase